jgi:hypothetical protein
MPFAAQHIPVANSALTLVGTRLISAVTDASKECALLKANWDTYRRAVLRDGIWKFAKQYVGLRLDPNYGPNNSALPAGANANTSGIQGSPSNAYAYRYSLPADFIRLVNFNDFKGDSDGSDAPYRVMGGFIYTNMSYANLTYVSDVSESQASGIVLWDPLFCEALSAYIYQALCKTLTGAEADPKRYKDAMQKARFVDSVEDPSVQLDVDVWLQSRVGSQSLFRDPQFAYDPNLDFPTQAEQS